MAGRTSDNPRKRPKGDKRARTRATLLAAARELVREKGYAHVSMEEVAGRAGMTSGAIYGNFKNRADLFVALGEAYWAPIKPDIKQGASFAQAMRAMAKATIAAIPERSDAAAGRLTGMAYALGDAGLRAKVTAVTAESYEAGAAWLAATFDKRELPMRPELLVRVIHALTEGLVLQRLLTPDLVSDAVIHAAFAGLAGRGRAK